MLRNAVLDSLTFSCRFGSGIGLRLPRVRRNLLTTRSNASGSDRDLTTTQRQPQTASLLDGGKRVAVQSSGNTVQYHGAWLRHNCQCDQCLNRDCNQKSVRHTLLRDVAVTDVTISDNDVYFTWRNTAGEHTGHISLDWLLEHRYSTERIGELAERARPDKTCQDSVPVLHFDDVMQSDEELWRWLYHLNEVGMCLINDIPTRHGNVAKLAERVAYVQETLYGKTFQVITSINPINLAYTGAALPLHMDLPFCEAPPGLQLLHCLEYDDGIVGGESLLLDTFPVVEKLRKEHPEEFQTLTRVPATYQRIHDGRKDPVNMWKQIPHIVLGPNDEVVSINWGPAVEGPLHVSPEDVEPYYKAYDLFATMINNSENIVQFKLRPGQVITMNNRRTLHGRNSFQQNSGTRHLEGVYVGADEFRSKFAVLNSLYGVGNAKRVFNRNVL